MEQQENLLELLKKLKERDYDICLYTGWFLEEVPREFLNLIDYLKVGEFVENLKNKELTYVGSSNQTIYKVENMKLIKI